MFKSKSRNKAEGRDLETIIGIVMTVYNGINSQAKEMFIPEDRKIFLSHLAQLFEQESKLISSPVGDLIKKEGGTDETA